MHVYDVAYLGRMKAAHEAKHYMHHVSLYADIIYTHTHTCI